MTKLNPGFALAALYVLMVIFFLMHTGVENLLISNIVYQIAPLTAFFTGVITLRHLGWSGKRAAVLKWSVAALFAWVLAELTTVYFSWKAIPLSPSIIDAFFLSGYVLFSGAVLREAKLFDVKLNKLSSRLLLSLVGVFVLLSGVVGYSAAISYRIEDGLLSHLAVVSWSIGDLIMGGLALLLLAMVWEHREGAVRRGWLWFIMATLANLIPDIIFMITPAAIEDGSLLSVLLNSFWVGGYFLFTAYFLEMDIELKRIRAKASSL